MVPESAPPPDRLSVFGDFLRRRPAKWDEHVVSSRHCPAKRFDHAQLVSWPTALRSTRNAQAPQPAWVPPTRSATIFSW